MRIAHSRCSFAYARSCFSIKLSKTPYRQSFYNRVQSCSHCVITNIRAHTCERNDLLSLFARTTLYYYNSHLYANLIFHSARTLHSPSPGRHKKLISYFFSTVCKFSKYRKRPGKHLIGKLLIKFRLTSKPSTEVCAGLF